MKELLKALSEVQNELKAPKGQRNSFGNYNYRSAEDILEAVKPILKAHKLTMTISDTMENLGDRFYVKATVTVYHTETGESLTVDAAAREALDKKGMDSSQITGATSSYARKYALNGMFNIDDTKDADTDEYQRKTQVKKPVGETREDGHDAEITARLNAKKKELNEKLIAHDYTRSDQKTTFITMVLGKKTIDTLEDADSVEDALNNEE